MSEIIFAIIGLIVGGVVGMLISSMCAVSKRADEDAERMANALIGGYRVKNRVGRICPHCGSIGRGKGI